MCTSYHKKYIIACLSIVIFTFYSCSDNVSTSPEHPILGGMTFLSSNSNMTYEEQIAMLDTTNVRAMIKIQNKAIKGKLVRGSYELPLHQLNEQIETQFYDNNFNLVEIGTPRWNNDTLMPIINDGSISFYVFSTLWESHNPNRRLIFTPGQQGIFAMDSSAHYPAASIPITVHNLITPQNYQASDTISADSAFTAQWSGGVTNQGFLTVSMSSTDPDRSGVPHHLTIYKGINNTQSMLIPASALQAYRNGFIQFTIEINTVNMVTLANGRKVAVWQVVEDIRTVYVK